MSITRRMVLGAAAIGLAVAVVGTSIGGAGADESRIQPYTAQAFDAAQKAGKPILVDTYATWCEICARQAPIIDKLVAEPKYKNLVVFRVNFDTQKDAMRRFNARMQSTLISFRGTKEVGRSVGETQPEWIDDQLSHSVGEGTS